MIKNRDIAQAIASALSTEQIMSCAEHLHKTERTITNIDDFQFCKTNCVGEENCNSFRNSTGRSPCAFIEHVFSFALQISKGE